MNEIQALLEAFAALKRDSTRAALATVVKVRGSAYRRPGARMLIAPDGRTVGSISAGCLDRDVCERAQKVIASEVPAVATYDTTAAGDDVWGLGLGCAGLVEVLIEPLGQDAPANQVLTFLGERVTRRDVGVVVTVFRGVGGVAGAVGSRLMLTEGGLGFCNVEDALLAQALTDEARQALQEGRSRVKEYAVPGGTAEALVEVVSPPAPLLIFGAGDDAVPLGRLAKEIGWHVTVVDNRPGFATPERFPWADAVVVVRPEDVAQRIPMDDRTAAVVMTHNYAHDLELLKMLLPSPVRYLGILGARGRTLAMLRALKEAGPAGREHDLAKVYSPVGMDIGAETPEEIALAILAEIKAVCTHRWAGFLRDRRGPIHDRTDAGNLSVGPVGGGGITAPAARRSHDG
ncbi:MAG: XdhC family protein [Candidatus Methylomirabilales bacterium]